jgi:hypothetical protein
VLLLFAANFKPFHTGQVDPTHSGHVQPWCHHIALPWPCLNQQVDGHLATVWLPCCVQVCEVMIYLALLADWSVLATGHSAWKPIALLFGTATLPIMYSRKIVDFGSSQC